MAIRKNDLRAEIAKLVPNRPEEAVRVAEHNLEKNPADIAAILLVAELYSLGLGKGPPAAKRLYEEVLGKAPDNPRALTGLALQPGVSVTESLSLLSKAADIARTIPAYRNLAYKQWENGLYDGARQTFDQILRLAREKRNFGLMIAALNAIHELRLRRRPRVAVYGSI